jgi:hypothetical protein
VAPICYLPGVRTLALLLLVAAAGCGDDVIDLDAGDRAALGKLYVDKRMCLDCHGMDLAGSATPRPNTMAYPHNLTPDRETGIGTWADITIVRALRAGIDDENQELCPTMPKLPDMSDVEAYSIVAYLRSLPEVSRPDIPESMCPPIKPRPEVDMSVTPLPPDLMPAADLAGGNHD